MVGRKEAMNSKEWRGRVEVGKSKSVGKGRTVKRGRKGERKIGGQGSKSGRKEGRERELIRIEWKKGEMMEGRRGNGGWGR